MTVSSHTADFAGFKSTFDRNTSFHSRVLKAHVGIIEAMTIVGVELSGAFSAVKTDVIGANKGAITLTGAGAGAGAKVGRYVIECTEPYVAAGAQPAIFQVTDPDGDPLPALVAGVAYNAGGLTFTKPSGTGDAAGDQAYLDVSRAAGSGLYVPLNPAASNGSEIPAGILPERTHPSTTNDDVLIIDGGPTVVSNACLVYGTADAATIRAIDAALLENCGITVIAGVVI